MSDATGVERSQPSTSLDPRWMSRLWVGFGILTIVLASAVAYRPSFDTPGNVLLAAIPILVFALILLVLAAPLIELGATAHRIAAVAAIAGWAVMMFQNDDWSLLTFAIYAGGFSAGTRLGLVLSGVISVLWALAWIAVGAPIWAIIVPFGIFVVGLLIWSDIRRVELLNREQAELIEELRATRADLATSERSKGMLEERARFASEIHDTLAQGFTSIVLLSRAGLRTGEPDSALQEIETTAVQNLGAARRLVDAIGPAELDAASLPDALDRQVSNSLPPDIAARFQVIGTPRRLTGTVEVTLLRATQEALLNVRTHANAKEVEVTLSYLDDVVALDVRDDGIGFVPDEVNNRGELTGGQGLRVLERRTKALSGEFTVEGRQNGGSVVSIQLPTETS